MGILKICEKWLGVGQNRLEREKKGVLFLGFLERERESSAWGQRVQQDHVKVNHLCDGKGKKGFREVTQTGIG